MRYIGIDGCKSGWFYIELTRDSYRHGWCQHLDELFERLDSSTRVFIDMPIGLTDPGSSGRDCDRAARKLLGPRRASVFPTPARAALNATNYAAACGLNRSAVGKAISLQTYAIMPKIRELDAWMQQSAAARACVYEAHPEVCFWSLAGGRPMSTHKSKPAGFEERLSVLERVFPSARAAVEAARVWARGRGVARDDIVDALVNAVSASVPSADLRTLPEEPPLDVCALPMRMVYGCVNLTV